MVARWPPQRSSLAASAGFVAHCIVFTGCDTDWPRGINIELDDGSNQSLDLSTAFDGALSIPFLAASLLHLARYPPLKTRVVMQKLQAVSLD